MRSARVRAPELTARGGWLNTAGPLTLADLRGRIVLLDFWTGCCANCLHVLDELRPLEAKYEDVLVVIGVHSPKFAHETDHATVVAAVDRYEVAHPVLDDPDLHLWQQYAVKAWPTLVVLDPEGYVVAQAAGEGQVSGLDAVIADLVETHSRKGTLHRGAGPYVAPAAVPGDLRFPAGVVRVGDSLLVADAGHHQIVELALDASTVRRRIGGRRGAPFAEPNGLALLPDGDVLVADTANHVLRRLSDPDTAIGLDRGLRTVTGTVPGVLSPWDVAWWPAIERVVVAAAGVHLLLTWDPATDEVAVLAGTTVEGLRDGPALDAWLAQPSGLAVDGDRLWFVDAETSALRWVDTDRLVHTAVGEGLFDFGFVDGPVADARLQHPLGVAVVPGGIAVFDTYNGAVRLVANGQVSTLASGLAEPSGGVHVDGELLVVESGAHRLVALAPDPRIHHGPALQTQRPAATVGPGAVRLDVVFAAPPGRTLDERDGPATRLTVSATPPQLLLSGEGAGTDLSRTVRLAAGDGVLHVTAQAASCDADPTVEHPACHLSRQDWGVPVHVVDGGPDRIELVLLGQRSS